MENFRFLRKLLKGQSLKHLNIFSGCIILLCRPPIIIFKTKKKQKNLTWLNDNFKNTSTYLRFIFGLSANLGYLGGN